MVLLQNTRLNQTDIVNDEQNFSILSLHCFFWQFKNEINFYPVMKIVNEIKTIFLFIITSNAMFVQFVKDMNGVTAVDNTLSMSCHICVLDSVRTIYNMAVGVNDKV